jgi:hypothetical protein
LSKGNQRSHTAWPGTALHYGVAGSPAWSPTDGFVYSIYQIDPFTGATLAKYDPGLVATGLAFSDGNLYVSDVQTDTIYILAIPEPAAGLLLVVASVFVCRSSRARLPEKSRDQEEE